MRRQRYYPNSIGEQGNWNGNFSDKLTQYKVTLSLSDEQVNQGVADARYMQYCLSHWLTDVRSFSLAATQALDVLSAGTGATPYAYPSNLAPLEGRSV